MPASPRRGEASLIWIGAFKLLKGILLAVVATELLKTVNSDLQTTLTRWVMNLHLDPGNHFITALLQKAGFVEGKTLKHLSWLTFTYGAVFLTEGTGLVLKKHWAEYLTVGVTLSLVPFEVYELAKHFTALKLIVLIINIAIAIYLIVMIRRKPDSGQ